MKKIFSIIAIVVLGALIGSCSGANIEKDNKAKVIRINISDTIASCIQQTMQMEQFLEKYLPGGVTAEWTNIAATPDIRDAIATNRIDIGSFSIASYISSIENGMPLVALSGTLPLTNELVTTRSGINSFSDINEQHSIVMLSRGSSAELAFSLRCKEVFGNAAVFSQNIVVIPNAEMAAMIQGNDDYDLYAPAFPFLQKMAELENVKVVEGLSETAVKYGIGSILVTSEDFYKNNPELIEAFQKASLDTVRHLKENTEEAAQKLAWLYGDEVMPEDVAAVLKRCPPELRITSYDIIADLLYEMGILSEPAMKFHELPYYSETLNDQ